MPTQQHDKARQTDPAASPRSDRRAFLRTGSALAAGLALFPGVPRAAAPLEAWCATWGTAPAGPPPSASLLSFTNQTLRLIVRTSIGGNRVQVRLSNEFGSMPLQIGAAWLGLTSTYASLAPNSNRQLGFGGKPTATILPGAPLLSDPLDVTLPPFSTVALSLYLPGSVQATTIHDAAFQTSYASPTGNYADAAALPIQRSLYSWPFLTEIDVAGGPAPGAAVVVLGDSQTDGAGSGGSVNRRWPDWLARRLATECQPGTAPLGVVNRGISANRLLADAASSPLAGRDALERFDRDVLATAGVRYLAVLLGVNDLIYSPSSSIVSAEELAAGYLQLIARAHACGIQVLGGTLLPFEGYRWYLPAHEAVRQAANDWIRHAGAFDAVIDFDAALRDPDHLTCLAPRWDSGDHLHPNDAGYEAMAKAVPLEVFMTT